MSIFSNFPLITALLAIGLAQFVKVPIHFFVTRKINWGLLTSTGSMPSSHSAAVSGLTTAVGLQEGFDSPLFAISAIFAVIVMFDATGIRYQAGQQAAVINQMRDDFQQFVQVSKEWAQKDEPEKRQELKTLLGHKPSEVFFGACTGVGLALILYFSM
ncbi:divergent PAP2 family protein [Savagea sp. SN6]|uniref:Divergent PAP2 family protein n=1 Tax=Savagea serpentis TaxID=2785297 RepID=A0A8J7GCU6_9BACL|nr:divergent PAP2 family protein [Savagea serpentis]